MRTGSVATGSLCCPWLVPRGACAAGCLFRTCIAHEHKREHPVLEELRAPGKATAPAMISQRPQWHSRYATSPFPGSGKAEAAPLPGSQPLNFQSATTDVVQRSSHRISHFRIPCCCFAQGTISDPLRAEADPTVTLVLSHSMCLARLVRRKTQGTTLATHR